MTRKHRGDTAEDLAAGVVSIDQTPIRGSRRRNPATYTGVLDPIRTAFAALPHQWRRIAPL